MKNLKIILLSSAFNGLTQRIWLNLQESKHLISVLLFTTESEVVTTIENANPDIVICPFLKDRIPEQLWKNKNRPIIIIHPGIIGDRGASSLDWAILNKEKTWGVTALQAIEEMDAGPIWASYNFEVPDLIRKSELYNNQVSDIAIKCVLKSIDNYINNIEATPLDYQNPKIEGKLQPNMKQIDRHINWQEMTAETILNRINTAEGIPGVLTDIEGEYYYVFDAHLDNRKGKPGSLLAKRDDAVLIATVDKSIWIGYLKPYIKNEKTFKIPAVEALKEKASILKDLSQNWENNILLDDEYSPIHYSEIDSIGILSFDFYNGAMSTLQCKRLCKAIQYAKKQNTSILILKGGVNSFSNGIHLNTIEMAVDSAEESWENIQAIDDVCLELLEANQFIISAITGNSGAGGVMLALTADYVWARDGIILNPHYATMGLYGSEYWTYTLPLRVGKQKSIELTSKCLPIDAKGALKINLIDKIGPRCINNFTNWLVEEANKIDNNEIKTYKKKYDKELARKCRENELLQMKEDLLKNRNDFNLKRKNFVFKKKACETPKRLISRWY